MMHKKVLFSFDSVTVPKAYLRINIDQFLHWFSACLWVSTHKIACLHETANPYPSVKEMILKPLRRIITKMCYFKKSLQ